jgi:hypothetical protein
LDTQIKLIGNGKKYTIKSVFNDEALRGVVNANINLGDSVHQLMVETDIDHADLHALNLTNREFDLTYTASIEADFKSIDEISGTYIVNNLKLNKPGKSFQIDEISLLAVLNPESSKFELKSDIIDTYLAGNIKATELKSVFFHHLAQYISLPDSLLSDKAYYFNFDLQLKNAGFFTTFLFDDLHEISLEQCHARYDQRTDLFEASLKIPTIKYSNLGFDDIDFSVQLSQGQDQFIDARRPIDFGRRSD